MRPYLPRVLAVNAGFVDTAGFLALQGLFTAHVTGNFVTLGAALARGSTAGALSKLMALPVFCVVLVVARLLTMRRSDEIAAIRALLGAQCLLLSLAAIIAIAFGPFPDGDGLPAIAAGMTLVAAMAVQNGFSRAHLASSPPTTLMTGSTTQMMMDLAEMFGWPGSEAAGAARARLFKFAPVVLAFALGCALGAVCFRFLHQWCLVLPALVSLVPVVDTLFFPNAVR